jgi:nucleotide-binding universal stress UspA family protein
MFQRVLTPLDGSAYAEAALPMAARIAQASQGTVVLLHVLSGPRELLPYILPMMEPSTLTADVDAASAYLDAVAAQPTLANVTTVSAVRSGLVASTILDMAAEQHADLVVLAAHAHTGLARWATGDVVSRLEQRGVTPVLSMTDANTLPGEGQLVQALVLLDGAMEAEAAIAPAKEILTALSGAQHTSATLRLAWIGAFEPGAPNPGAAQSGDSDVARYLRSVEERLHGESTGNWPLTVTSEVIAEEDLPRAVTDLAQQKQATFLALAPHARRGFPLHTSSDFDAHLREATKLPLLLVPAHAAHPASEKA